MRVAYYCAAHRITDTANTDVLRPGRPPANKPSSVCVVGPPSASDGIPTIIAHRSSRWLPLTRGSTSLACNRLCHPGAPFIFDNVRCIALLHASSTTTSIPPTLEAPRPATAAFSNLGRCLMLSLHRGPPPHDKGLPMRLCWRCFSKRLSSRPTVTGISNRGGMRA